MVFDIILLGWQSSQKLQCLYWNWLANHFFKVQLMNHNFARLGTFTNEIIFIKSDIAGLEDAQLIFNFLYICP